MECFPHSPLYSFRFGWLKRTPEQPVLPFWSADGEDANENQPVGDSQTQPALDTLKSGKKGFVCPDEMILAYTNTLLP